MDLAGPVCVCKPVCIFHAHFCACFTKALLSVFVRARDVVYISSVWCLHQRPLSSYFNTTVWSAPIWSWSLRLCLLSKTLFISTCFSNPCSPTPPVTLALRVCVCRFKWLLFSLQMCVSKMQKSQRCFTSVRQFCVLGFIHFSGIFFWFILSKNISALDFFERSRY